ncbi:UDP-glucose/GDP-mannose dehydrogenase family protein [Mesorhizobium sp. CN2-181]|uniref:UDP-glucose dehydrogenase family protein n=1 Tax=Mesorhizobium yinganensis TaxID=3157707 RepID=UPI0032B7A419
MRIAVIGTGYVGLVTGACLAHVGWDVTCVDNVPGKIEGLRSGIVPIYEPGLEDLVLANKDRLRFTTTLADAIDGAEIIIIAVGTPTRKLDGNADLRYIFAAAKEIAQSLRHYAVIVTKSTVPAGTSFQIKRIIAQANSRLDFDVASNPEFLREGNAIDDFLNPDRIVIGTESGVAARLLENLYRPFTEKGVELIRTDIVSSELIKYAANTFLATKVSFINEMADICEKVGGNIDDVARGMGSDTRIGEAFLRPGPGYGGSCFPKDTLAMARIGQKLLSPASIVEAVISVNRLRTHRMVAKIVHAAGDDVRGKRIALLGLTFKPNTDDVRDSVPVVIAEELSQLGAQVRAYDPKGMEQARGLLGDAIEYCECLEDAVTDAQVCVIATEWKEFREKKPGEYKHLMARRVMVDLRNVFSLKEMSEAGFSYFSIGRPAIEDRTVSQYDPSTFERKVRVDAAPSFELSAY